MSSLMSWVCAFAALAQFLPVRPERYLSDARRQLDTALAVLTATGVLAGANWTVARGSLGQLHLYRGQRLAASTGRETLHEQTQS